ncbi:hypothetical protein CAEBREN_02883 [Caenorhabditis brenneri]|uniref:Exocyst complex component Sec6 n=1 Tax=Caenorhabditis brenneri TaxID=135651 RepID=G0PIF0_CAEBE|nr:hypothetical protein CAEBREN_02883 [Caenorhabditis brenneri]
MQALRDRLQQLEDPTGWEIWETWKASEPELREELASLNATKQEKEKQSREALAGLKLRKKALTALKEDVLALQNEYKNYVKAVEQSFKESGLLDMKLVVNVFEKVLENSLSEKKTTILETLSSTDFTNKKTISELHTTVKTALSLLNDQNQEKLREIIQGELQDFHKSSNEIFRSNLWSELQKQGVPMKKLSETPNYQDFLQRLTKIFEFSCDLDLLLHGNHQESIGNLIHVSFGKLSNHCVDMVDSEKEKDSDFEWILMSAHEWAKHLKEVIEKAVEKLEIDEKLKEKTGEIFNEKFVEFVGTITKRFVRKNLEDPMIFSKLATLLRRFEEKCDFDLTDKDLFEPLYEPEFMSKWISLEVELFSLSIKQLLRTPDCFKPLDAISIGSKSEQWASEITVFFEQWICRVDKDVSSLGNSEIQCTFYECLHALMLDLCSKIHVMAKRLYEQPSWSNNVYLVMNSIWELRRIVQTLTVTWPVSSFEVEKAYDEEWKRLSGMIVEYLNTLVNSMDQDIRSSYSASGEKIKCINDYFYHILKCLKNVTIKASRPSRSPLLNVLTEQLFKNLQGKFEKWKSCCSVDTLGRFYDHIYSNILPQLDYFHQQNEWTRGDEARTAICHLDALMKVAANRDPSGELVRTAFRSIDEEQVVKILGELGYHSTSDHAFQDYQILAENWHKIEEKGYGYGKD